MQPPWQSPSQLEMLVLSGSVWLKYNLQPLQLRLSSTMVKRQTKLKTDIWNLMTEKAPFIFVCVKSSQSSLTYFCLSNEILSQLAWL